jgi:hypothetical protein
MASPVSTRGAFASPNSSDARRSTNSWRALMRWRLGSPHGRSVTTAARAASLDGGHGFGRPVPPVDRRAAYTVSQGRADHLRPTRLRKGPAQSARRGRLPRRAASVLFFTIEAPPRDSHGGDVSPTRPHHAFNPRRRRLRLRRASARTGSAHHIASKDVHRRPGQ